jgi:hypothetical protein
VEHVGERCIYGFEEKPEGKDYLQDLGVDGRIVLKCILKK